jgi:hypothetical protein
MIPYILAIAGGFVDNKGKNKVWNTTAGMVRQPKNG